MEKNLERFVYAMTVSLESYFDPDYIVDPARPTAVPRLFKHKSEKENFRNKTMQYLLLNYDEPVEKTDLRVMGYADINVYLWITEQSVIDKVKKDLDQILNKELSRTNVEIDYETHEIDWRK